MSILLAIVGATVGAVIGSLFMHWRNDVAKEQQQLESKTPYDYALTNAINERDRLQGELVTIQALKRTEADTERIRIEIGTILSDGGEEATEDAYEPNIGMPIQDNGDGTFSPITWDNRISSGELADNISKAVARANGTIVREDDTKDEQSSEDDVERSLTKAVRDSFENKEIIQVTWRDSSGSLRFRRGVVDAMSTGDGKVKEFGMQGLGIFAKDVVEIKRGRYTGSKTLYRKGDDASGETLYRKGSR